MRKLGLMLAAVMLTSLPTSAALEAAPAKARPCPERSIVKTAAPFGTTACAGVRPGGLVEFRHADGGTCSLGFVYSDKYGQLFITTAGHCVVPTGAYKLWAVGKGPVAYVGGKAVGRAVYARNDPEDPYVYDIAMIQITKGVKVNPQVCHFGGPTSASSTTARGDQVQVYGNAQGLSEVLPARTLISLGNSNTYDAWIVGPSLFGDSGAPVVSASSGKAIGFITAIGYDLRSTASPGVDMLVKRLGPQMYAVSKALHKTFYLKTAKRL
jgi:hypothetical protein